MARRKGGPISREVRHLCLMLSQDKITESDFKDGIKKIM